MVDNDMSGGNERPRDTRKRPLNAIPLPIFPFIGKHPCLYFWLMSKWAKSLLLALFSELIPSGTWGITQD